MALHSGALYFSSLEQKVRRVDLTTGNITTVAGTGVIGYSGDGGPAKQATLHAPQRLAIDSVGNIYVADSGNNAIRRIDATSGVITTVAGTGTAGSTGDGGAGNFRTARPPSRPRAGGRQTLYIADSDIHRVRLLA